MGHTERCKLLCFLGESRLGQVSLELPGEPEEEASEVGLEAPRPAGDSEPGILRAPCDLSSTPAGFVSFHRQPLPETACLPGMCYGAPAFCPRSAPQRPLHFGVSWSQGQDAL